MGNVRGGTRPDPPSPLPDPPVEEVELGGDHSSQAVPPLERRQRRRIHGATGSDHQVPTTIAALLGEVDGPAPIATLLRGEDKPTIIASLLGRCRLHARGRGGHRVGGGRGSPPPPVEREKREKGLAASWHRNLDDFSINVKKKRGNGILQWNYGYLREDWKELTVKISTWME